ncbi:MAG: DUF2135 domain-containing protein, partial [Fibromonadales bacterium]|nr:DUF2135 domain-containing protein [Fibromonadales bacterium]
DNANGYGPEQFMLKKAIKGKYKVYANYYNASEFANDGPSTVMAEIFTKFSDKTEKRQVVSLQVPRTKKDSKVKIAEFEF